MKIGILTYHRSHNYGALLQAIALRKVLADMGNEVLFVDYWPAYHRHMYALFSPVGMMSRKGLKSKWRYMCGCAVNFLYRKERRSHFLAFIKAYIQPFVSPMTESYDLIVHGSDQIWRKQPEIRTYNPVYFGKHDIPARRKVSYAASMGIVPSGEEDKNTLAGYLSNLDGISVREDALASLVRELGFSCNVHLDPTLLLTAGQWQQLMKAPTEEGKEEKYVLFYSLLPGSFDTGEVRRLADRKGLRLRILYSSATRENSEDFITSADPMEFLSLVRGAEFVFTSSYHGLVFSLIFGKPFFAAFSRNAGRASSLLAELGLSDHMLSPLSTVPTDIPPIDYAAVHDKLAVLRQESLTYLRSVISVSPESQANC